MLRKLKVPLLPVLSWVMVVILTLCNILLIRQNSQLRIAVQKLESEQRIQIGDKFGSFRGTDLEGKPVAVNFDENNLKKIVLFSSISCPFCKKQNPKWNQLIEKIDRQKYEVVELFRDKESRNQVAAYLKANSFSNEDSVKVFLVGDEFLKEKKLNGTPITLIVGQNGVVERAWIGLWNESAIAEVNSILDISIRVD
jgi:thiol-disulfide isomerase/thioredoxin